MTEIVSCLSGNGRGRTTNRPGVFRLRHQRRDRPDLPRAGMASPGKKGLACSAGPCSALPPAGNTDEAAVPPLAAMVLPARAQQPPGSPSITSALPLLSTIAQEVAGGFGGGHGSQRAAAAAGRRCGRQTVPLRVRRDDGRREGGGRLPSSISSAVPRQRSRAGLRPREPRVTKPLLFVSAGGAPQSLPPHHVSCAEQLGQRGIHLHLQSGNSRPHVKHL